MNFYVQFCVAIKVSPEEANFLKKVLEGFDLIGATNEDEDFDSTTYENKLAQEIMNRVDRGGMRQLDFAYAFDGTEFICFADEVGNPDHVAYLMHVFLREMRPNESDEIAISWANTASKTTPDGFGGGVVVATRKGIGFCTESAQLGYALAHIEEPIRQS